MRQLPALLAWLMIALVAAGCQTSKPAESLLFVQTAASARLTPLAGEDGPYTLDLIGVGDKVTYFSDRPNRETGTMPTHELVDHWNRGADSFEKDPPNAAVTVAGSDSIWVFEMADPVQDGTNLRYTIRLLEDSPHFRLSPAGEPVPRTAEHVVLFIDNLSYYKRNPMNRTDNFGRRR